MVGKLNAKVAIVTGAGQGVGRGIALALAKEGAAVVIGELNPGMAAVTEKEIKALGGQAVSIACDVRRRQEVDAMVAAAVKEFGTVDILVNNAQQYVFQTPFEETTDAAMALTLESGLMGTFYFMQACFPSLKKRGGKIINVGSEAGLEGMAGMVAYAACKEAIRAMTRMAAHEWGRYKINVNCICPASGMVAELPRRIPGRARENTTGANR